MTEKNKREKAWTEEQYNFLKNNINSMSRKEISDAIGRTVKAVNLKVALTKELKDLAIPKSKAWTDEEDSYVICNFSVLTFDEMAKELGRTRTAVKHRANRKLGLYSNDHENYLSATTIFYCEEGLSIPEIARRLNKSKDFIKSVVKESGLVSKYNAALAKAPEGYSVCKKCYCSYPFDKDHFDNSYGRLSHVCKPCKKISKINNEIKSDTHKCRLCGEIKPRTDFTSNKGKIAECKDCKSKKNKIAKTKAGISQK